VLTRGCWQDATEEQALIRPVIRTFYDHTAPINDVAFHPTQPLLASCGMDKTIRMYDYSKPLQMKRSTRCFTDSHNVRCISFHPSGKYLLAGTDHTAVTPPPHPAPSVMCPALLARSTCTM
jgi:cleavage stimulation factor subunit 1